MNTPDLFDLPDDNKPIDLSIHLRNLTKADLDLINEVREETGEKVNSKALLEAYAGYLLYKRKYANLESRYLTLVKKTTY